MNFFKFIKLFILCFALIGLTACSEENPIFKNNDTSSTTKSANCGASDSTSNLVAENSFAICSKDISYNILYMIFDKSFLEYKFFNIFVDSSVVKASYSDSSANIATPDLANKAYAANIGASVMAMLTGFTQLVLIIAAILHSYSTLVILWRAMMSGEFLQGMSKVWVVGRALLSIALITPLGTLNLVQICILTLAMIAIMFANFFTGVFLNKIQTDSMNAEASTPETMFESAVGESTSLVSASLCQIRTTQALRQARFSDASDLNGFFSEATVDDQFKRLGNCIAPETKLSLTPDNATTLSASFSNAQSCKDGSNFDATKDGYGYQCGGLSFSYPDITITTSKGTSLNTSTPIYGTGNANIAGSGILGFKIGGSTVAEKADEVSNEIAGSVNIENVVNGYYQNALSAVKSGSIYDYTAADSALTSTIQQKLSPVFDEMLANNYDYETAVQVLGALYSSIYAKLMGSYSPQGVRTKSGIISSNFGSGKFDAIRENDFIWDIEKYSSKAAESLVISHCLRNMSNNYRGIQNQIDSMSGAQGMKYTSFYKEKSPTYIGECSWITASEGKGVGFNNKFEGDTSGVTAYNGDSSVLLTIGSGKSILDSMGKNGTPADSGAITTQVNQLSQQYVEQAQAYKLGLATYFYSVRKGIQDSFAAIIKDKKVDDTQLKMRQQGWASLGGYIMAISANQTNVKRMLQTTTNSATWSGFGSGDDLFVNKDGFVPASRNVNTLPEEFKFNIMFFKDFFGSGINTTSAITSESSSGVSTSKDEVGAFDTVMRWIEKKLTYPMKYLKQAGGMPLDQPLRIGVQKCFEEGNCFNGTMHPVNAVIYVGQDLIELSVTLLITKAITSIIIWLSDSVGEGTVSKAGLFSKLVPIISAIANFIVMAAKLVDATLTALMPFILLLLALGVFLCYIVPLMPYMAFLILFLGWIVLIVTMMFSMPIWALMMSLPGPTGESRANMGMLWSYLGQILVRPSLMVIGTVIGWYFSVVSLYFINLTLFGVLAPISENSGLIMSFINVVMFYVAYMVIVFVALKHSFSIISTFPDKVSEVMDIKGNGDERMVESLRTDQLVQAIVAKQVLGEIKNTTRTIGNQVQNARTKKGQEYRDKENIRRMFEEEKSKNDPFSDTSGRSKNLKDPRTPN